MSEYREFQEYLLEKLRDPERAQQYLDVALEEYFQDGDLGGFLLALRRVAEAQGGLSKLSRDAELNRSNLYEALSESGSPRFETIGTIVRSMGLRLSVAKVEESA